LQQEGDLFGALSWKARPAFSAGNAPIFFVTKTMSLNKLALLRYKTIDECLQNRYRKWTLDDLIDKVAEALYEYEGIRTGVSRRTIQADIQLMRSNKLGYEAPIEVVDKKFYTYSDKTYSITKSKVSQQEVAKLEEVVSVLRQFKGFNFFEDIGEIVGRLEDKITKQQSENDVFMLFESNPLLKGLGWIDILLPSIREQNCIDLTYQSFKARQPSTLTVSPYLLKEYRNRWFLLGRKHYKSDAKRPNYDQKDVAIFALDRIVGVATNLNAEFQAATNFDAPTFFDNTIGVTKSIGAKTMRIVMRADRSQAPYILTKPLHSSQKVIKNEEKELIFEIEVVPNYELEREILSFGAGLTVLHPRLIKKRIKDTLEKMLRNYDD
jgi:predicted DNA-binding transcriptional regulator YafY